jgi:hypothetical protein
VRPRGRRIPATRAYSSTPRSPAAQCPALRGIRQLLGRNDKQRPALRGIRQRQERNDRQAPEEGGIRQAEYGGIRQAPEEAGIRHYRPDHPGSGGVSASRGAWAGPASRSSTGGRLSPRSRTARAGPGRAHEHLAAFWGRAHRTGYALWKSTSRAAPWVTVAGLLVVKPASSAPARAAPAVSSAHVAGAVAGADSGKSSAFLRTAGPRGIQPRLQDGDGRSLVDDRTLPATAHPTVAKCAGRRNGRQSLVGQSHRYWRDPRGEGRRIGPSLLRGWSKPPGERPRKTYHNLNHLVLGNELSEPCEIGTRCLIPGQGNQGRRQHPSWITERYPDAHGTHVDPEPASHRRSNRGWFHQPHVSGQRPCVPRHAAARPRIRCQTDRSHRPGRCRACRHRDHRRRARRPTRAFRRPTHGRGRWAS